VNDLSVEMVLRGFELPHSLNRFPPFHTFGTMLFSYRVLYDYSCLLFVVIVVIVDTAHPDVPSHAVFSYSPEYHCVEVVPIGTAG